MVPISIETRPQAGALALAALFGLLTALPFILWPVGRAQEVRAAELFRDMSGERAGLPPLAYSVAAFLAAGLLAVAAIVALSRASDRGFHLRCGSWRFRPVLGCGHGYSPAGLVR